MSGKENGFLKFFSGLFTRFSNWMVDLVISREKRKIKIETRTILIVDDKKELTNLLKYRLEDMGFNVVLAGDGVEGLARLRKIDPILIILDINMPNMGGLQFYQKISTKYGRPKYPVLFLTERADLEGVCKDVEADGFLAKPFEIEDLMKEVDRIITGNINPVIFLFDSPTNPAVEAIIGDFKKERYDVVVIDGLAEFYSRSQSNKPCCILVEYMQKDTSGENLIQKIKEDSSIGDVPVIAYSYSGFEQYEEKSLGAGATKYIDKPSSPEVLIAAIKEIRFQTGESS